MCKLQFVSLDQLFGLRFLNLQQWVLLRPIYT